VTYVASGFSRTAIRGVAESRRSERVRLKADTTYVAVSSPGAEAGYPEADSAAARRGRVGAPGTARGQVP